jgi:hypothetical protein
MITNHQTSTADTETVALPIPGKPSELMRLALLCSPTVVASLELKILARLAFELAEVPNNQFAPSLAFIGENLTAIAIRLNALDAETEQILLN